MKMFDIMAAKAILVSITVADAVLFMAMLVPSS